MARDGRSLRPLIYACSGCSSAAQMANDLALRLDREGVAEMSCIAGVGGDVAPLVRVARSGRPVIAIDGCPLRCAAACLARHGVTPAHPVVLSQHGVKKRKGHDFDPAEAAALLDRLRPEVEAVARDGAPGRAPTGSGSARTKAEAVALPIPWPSFV